MDNLLGIICARRGSKRLFGKNLLKIREVTLVERAIQTLAQAGINNLIVATDFLLDFDYKRYNATHIFRSQNISGDLLALQETVKWAYYSIDRRFETIVFLMPNCPMVTDNDVRRAIVVFHNCHCNIVRSYNTNGSENGLVVVKTEYLLNHYIDVYCGCIICGGSEIHNEADYVRMKKNVEER